MSVERLLGRPVDVLAVVGVGRRHDDLDLVEPGRQRPLGAAQVRHQRRVADVGVALHRGPDLGGVGHRRDRLGVHERHGLDPPDAGPRQRVDQRRPWRRSAPAPRSAARRAGRPRAATAAPAGHSSRPRPVAADVQRTHARPVRPALLVERRHALGPVAGEGGRPPGAVLDVQPGRQVDVRPLSQRPLGVAYSHRRVRGDDRRELAAPPPGRCPAATRRSTSPSRVGLGHVEPRPVKTRSAARAAPTRRTSSWVPPPPGITPTVTSGSPSDRRLVARPPGRRTARARGRRRARSRAPPRWSGTGRSRMPPKAARKCGRCAIRSASLNPLRSLRSAPTQNAFADAELTTTARTVSSAASAAVAAAISRAMAVDSALCASARSRTSSATCPPSPCRTTVTCSIGSGCSLTVADPNPVLTRGGARPPAGPGRCRAPRGSSPARRPRRPARPGPLPWWRRPGRCRAPRAP